MYPLPTPGVVLKAISELEANQGFRQRYRSVSIDCALSHCPVVRVENNWR